MVLPVEGCFTKWLRPSVRPSLCPVRARISRTENHRNYRFGEFALALISPYSDKKVKDQGHMDWLNFLIGEVYNITNMKSTAAAEFGESHDPQPLCKKH